MGRDFPDDTKDGNTNKIDNEKEEGEGEEAMEKEGEEEGDVLGDKVNDKGDQETKENGGISGEDSELKCNGVESEENAHEKDKSEVEGKETDVLSTSNDVDPIDKDNVEKIAKEKTKSLPDGWSKTDTLTGKTKVCYTSPKGDKLYSLEDLKTHCETHSLSVDYSVFDFPKPSNSRRSISPVNTESASPSASNSVMSIDLDSDSQHSLESPSKPDKPPERRQVSTSALLRAYRPRPRGAGSTRSSNRQAAAAVAATNQTNRKSPAGSPQMMKKSNKNNGTSISSDAVPGLIMECKTDVLSEAQMAKVQKFQEDLSRLQLLLLSGGNMIDKNGGTPPLMNGLGGKSGSSQSLSNSTNLLGLQVPQFLLLQNGQMIGSSGIAPNGQTITTTAASTGSQSTSSKNATSKSSKENTSTVSTRPQRSAKNNAANKAGRSSPDIQVLREMRVPMHVQGSPSSGPTSSSASTSTAPSGSGKGFPLLNIVCRPRNTLPPSAAMAQRKELDGKVKQVLVKTAQEFVEWLLSEGLIRTSQFCSLHKVQPSQSPFKLKLGMFSDPKVLSTSGGYVWISECCGKKYVSVYSGSIFGSTPIDKVAPTAVLKLVYHWSCQTSIVNVESWVKVEKTFVNKVYNYLRCVCSVMLQDKVYDFGFDGTTVELGIVSLGTSTADGTKKAVKVEILGLFDRKMKSYRLFASEPEPGSSSKQRFVRILKPLERVVHTNAILLCDQSVDRNCLYNMNYGKVSVCETSDNEDNLQSNARIMSYLRRHVPKMFQSTLSQLTLQQVQIVLDELCWRERFGPCAAQAYTTMTEHIMYLTAREAENPGVLHLLDFVAQKPQHNWRYKSQHVPKMMPSLQPSIIMSTPSAGTINPQVTVDMPHTAQSPLDHTNKVALTPRSRGTAPRDVTPTIPKASTSAASTSNTAPKPDAVELEPFYYGQIQGDLTLGREINNYSFTCHLCQDTFNQNVEFYTHLKGHLARVTQSQKFCCDYCTEHFDSESVKDYHMKFRHLQMDSRYTWCRICTESFPGEFQLVNHMAKKHYESELPYRCEVCNFTTSIYFSAINHFKEEHRDSPYVQCHYCLAVKTISSTCASSFSFRMLQHLQKHASQQGKCKSCSLSFYSKYLLDEHKKKDHVSRTNVAGLQRYKIPHGQSRIMFRPWVKRAATTNTSVTQLQASNTVAISSTLEKLESLVVNTDEYDRKFYCIECDASLALDQHFKAYQKCTKCVYSTCCRNMISKHAQVFHPNGKYKSGYYRIGPPIVLPQHMYCICGFSTRSGNHLARHLAMCEGGRKSAYPSMLDAMVYRGDPMTPSALALSSLGLSRMLPGSVTPAPPQLSLEPATNDAPLDMSHFMSMSMDVDEDYEDDPPMMPLSVELNE